VSAAYIKYIIRENVYASIRRGRGKLYHIQIMKTATPTMKDLGLCVC
jgi:hypothetical protein